MSGRLVVEKVALKNLQYYHHAWFNNFGEHETLLEAISNRPGFLGHNPITFLSLLVRRPSLHINDLDESLLNDKTLIRAPAFRGSLFLLNSLDYPIYFRTFSQFLLQRGMGTLLKNGIDKNHIALFIKKLNAALDDMPVTTDMIAQIIFDGFSQLPSKNTQNAVIQKLCDLGILVRATAKGWKGNDFTYALLEKWAPDICLKPDNPEIARTETVKRYLKAYGPASIEDISWWTGLNLSQCQRSISYLRKESIKFKVEGLKDDMIGLRENIELVRKKMPMEEQIGILPPWDPYTTGWRCRKRLVEKVYAPFVFDKNGNATSTIVHLGKIVGVWQFRDHEISIFEFHLFDKYKDLKLPILQKIEDFCQTLKRTSYTQMVNIIERPLPMPLDKTHEYNLLWPLGKNSHTPKEKEIKESVMERRTANTFRKSYLDNEYLVRPTAISSLTSRINNPVVAPLD